MGEGGHLAKGLSIDLPPYCKSSPPSQLRTSSQRRVVGRSNLKKGASHAYWITGGLGGGGVHHPVAPHHCRLRGRCLNIIVVQGVGRCGCPYNLPFNFCLLSPLHPSTIRTLPCANMRTTHLAPYSPASTSTYVGGSGLPRSSCSPRNLLDLHNICEQSSGHAWTKLET